MKYMSNFKSKLKKISLVLMALMMVVCAEPIPAKAASLDGMMIYGMYLDTKDKGDSVLIKSANEYILMDLGMYSNVPLICNQLDELGVKHFKLYLSHLHLDHVGGSRTSFLAGLNYLRDHGYTIDVLYVADPSLAPESEYYPEKYNKLRTYMNDYMGGEDRIMYLQQGSHFTVGYADFEVLGPSLEYVNSIHPDDYVSKVADSEIETEAGQKVKMTYYENDCSLITRVTCDGVSYLTGGDLLKVEADYLVEKLGGELKSDIYQLSHHGTALGSTRRLLESIDPIYTFAINNGSTSYDYELRQWAFNRSLTSAKPVSMPYYVANEKKTIAYRVADGEISLYQGESLTNLEKVQGWIAVYGADGINRKKDYYYIGENGVPLAGVQEIEGNKYYYSEGGSMDYGDYDEYGAYLGWKEYDTWKHRYFKLVNEEGHAIMLTGFQTIDGKLYYFDENGWKEEGGDEEGFIEIGDHTYLVDEDGVFATNELYELEGQQYYFGENGEMAVEQIVPIDGANYYFGKYGTKQYNLLTKVGEETYYFDEVGKMVTNREMLLDNKEYYFDKAGAMACRERVKRRGKYYYYGKYGTKVRDKIVKIDTNSYYFDADGIMTTDQMVTIGRKVYCFDKKGRMLCRQFMTDEEGKTYYFGKYGTMVKAKIVKVGADKYYFDADGVMAVDQMVTVGTKTYYFDKDGKMVYKQFVKDADDNLYYFGKKGTMAKAKTVRISGEEYTFDENGIVVSSDNTQKEDSRQN